MVTFRRKYAACLLLAVGAGTYLELTSRAQANPTAVRVEPTSATKRALEVRAREEGADGTTSYLMRGRSAAGHEMEVSVSRSNEHVYAEVVDESPDSGYSLVLDEERLLVRRGDEFAQIRCLDECRQHLRETNSQEHVSRLLQADHAELGGTRYRALLEGARVSGVGGKQWDDLTILSEMLLRNFEERDEPLAMSDVKAVIPRFRGKTDFALHGAPGLRTMARSPSLLLPASLNETLSLTEASRDWVTLGGVPLDGRDEPARRARANEAHPRVTANGSCGPEGPATEECAPLDPNGTVAAWNTEAKILNAVGIRIQGQAASVQGYGYFSDTGCGGNACSATPTTTSLQSSSMSGKMPTYYWQGGSCQPCFSDRGGKTVPQACGTGYANMSWSAAAGGSGYTFPAAAYPRTTQSYAQGLYNKIDIFFSGNWITILTVTVADARGIMAGGKSLYAGLSGKSITCRVNENGSNNPFDYNLSIYQANAVVNVGAGYPGTNGSCGPLNAALGVAPGFQTLAACNAADGGT